MAVNLTVPEKIHPVRGVLVGTACAGIKQTERDDIALFCFDEGSVVAGVYTQSHFAAAPVSIAKENEATSSCWIVNSGNANAATGNQGEADARRTCSILGDRLSRSDKAIQPFSTGVIGEFLPMDRIESAIDEAVSIMAPNVWEQAAKAIMTTDTLPKLVSSQVYLDDQLITFTGIAKGSGMIRPDMATMLAFIASDIAVERTVLKGLIEEVSEMSFNRITVDGDTSTNDCFMVACTGAAEMSPITDRTDSRYGEMRTVLSDHAKTLAQSIVRDGEGATKFVSVVVDGGANEQECLAVAYSIAESPLVKTALFAGDPNWGRFCMAIGKAPIEDVDTSLIELRLDDLLVAKAGMLSESYAEAEGAKVLGQKEFSVKINLGRGDASTEIWTTDLSYDYVKINAEYRT